MSEGNDSELQNANRIQINPLGMRIIIFDAFF